MIRLVLFILAGIFALAAGGKLWLVATDPFADIKLGFPLPIICLTIAAEFALVYLNLKAILRPPRSLPRLPLAWLANVAFLSILFIVSIARWAMGYVSCGCFGLFKLLIRVRHVSFATVLLDSACLDTKFDVFWQRRSHCRFVTKLMTRA